MTALTFVIAGSTLGIGVFYWLDDDLASNSNDR